MPVIITRADRPLLYTAVEESLQYMRKLKTRRERELIPLLRKEERRLKKWRDRREEILSQRMDAYGPDHPRTRQYKKFIQEMNDYVKNRRQNWRHARFQAAAHPATRLIVVIEGRERSTP